MKNSKSLLKRLGLAGTLSLAILPQYGCTADGDVDAEALGGIALMALGTAGQINGHDSAFVVRGAGEAIVEHSNARNSAGSVEVNVNTREEREQTYSRTRNSDRNRATRSPEIREFKNGRNMTSYELSQVINPGELFFGRDFGDLNGNGIVDGEEFIFSNSFSDNEYISFGIYFEQPVDGKITYQVTDLNDPERTSAIDDIGRARRPGQLAGSVYRPGVLTPGHYRASVYVNDQLVDSEDISVK